jgi:hypothetical protein
MVEKMSMAEFEKYEDQINQDRLRPEFYDITAGAR